MIIREDAIYGRQSVDHYALDQAPANIGHHFLELGPVGILAGIALVGVQAGSY